jgi:hypothetical protein
MTTFKLSSWAISQISWLNLTNILVTIYFPTKILIYQILIKDEAQIIAEVSHFLKK